jgi:hypothetical protein
MADKKTTILKPGKKPGAKKTGGRIAGTPNKTTAKVKEAILHAFETVGGASYLVKVAKEDPRTFCTLLGRILPAELSAEISGDMNTAVTFVMKYHESTD